jgi:hypothetical protein
MSGRADKRSSIERQLLEEPRRTAGRDGSGEPVRLGERDAGRHVVGYIDPDGLAWESRIERIVTVHGQRLAEALAPGTTTPGATASWTTSSPGCPTSWSATWPRRLPTTSG